MLFFSVSYIWALKPPHDQFVFTFSLFPPFWRKVICSLHIAMFLVALLSSLAWTPGPRPHMTTKSIPFINFSSFSDKKIPTLFLSLFLIFASSTSLVSAGLTRSNWACLDPQDHLLFFYSLSTNCFCFKEEENPCYLFPVPLLLSHRVWLGLVLECQIF